MHPIAIPTDEAENTYKQTRFAENIDRANDAEAMNGRTGCGLVRSQPELETGGPLR